MSLEEDVTNILQEADREQADRQKLQEHIINSMRLGQPGLQPGSQLTPQKLTQAPSEQPSILPDVAQTGLDIGAMMAGGARGAASGSRLGAPLGPWGAAAGGLVGGVLGAGMGGAASRSAGLTASEIAGLREPTSVEEKLAAIKRGAEEGAIGEIGGQALIHGGKAVGASVRRLLGGKATPEQLQLMQEAGQMGVQLRPAEVTENPVSMLLERSLRRTLGGQNTFRKVDFANDENFKMAVDTFAEREWGKAIEAHEVEDLVKRTIEGQVIPEGRQVVRGLYNHLKTATDGKFVVDPTEIFESVKLMKAAVDKDLHPKTYALLNLVEKQISEKGPITGLVVKRGEKTVPEKVIPSSLVDQTGQPYPSKVIPGSTSLKGSTPGGMTGSPQLRITEKSEGRAVPRPLDFLEAHDIRSHLLDIRRQGELLPDLVHNKASATAQMIDEAMGKAALTYDAATGKGIAQQWRAANQASKDMHELASASIIQRAVRDDPRNLYKSLLGKGSVRQIQQLEQALQNYPDVWKQVQHGAFEELLNRASKNGTVPINGTQFANSINALDDATMKSLFGQQTPQVRKFAAIASRMDNRALRGDTQGPGLLWSDIGMLASIPAGLTGAAMQMSVWPAVATGAGVATYMLSARRLAGMLNHPDKARILVGAMDAAEQKKWAVFSRLMSDLGTLELGELSAQRGDSQ